MPKKKRTHSNRENSKVSPEGGNTRRRVFAVSNLGRARPWQASEQGWRPELGGPCRATARSTCVNARVRGQIGSAGRPGASKFVGVKLAYGESRHPSVGILDATPNLHCKQCIRPFYERLARRSTHQSPIGPDAQPAPARWTGLGSAFAGS